MSRADEIFAATSPSGSTLTFTHADALNVNDSTLTIHFVKPLSSAQSASIKNTMAQKLAAPSGAYLYCNHAYSFSDSDGNYTFQHKCGGTTGPSISRLISTAKRDQLTWWPTGRSRRPGAPMGKRVVSDGIFNADRPLGELRRTETVAREHGGRMFPDPGYGPIVQLLLETSTGDQADLMVWQPEVEQFATVAGIRTNLLGQLEDWLPETRLHWGEQIHLTMPAGDAAG